MRSAWLMAVVVATLLGCADVKVSSQDYTTGIFTVCGDEFATTADLDKEASKGCAKGAPPRLLRCANTAYGSKSYSTAPGPYGSASYSTPLTGNCCEYQCPAQPPAEPGK